MSNLETQKAAYEAFGRGDIEAAFSNLHEDAIFRDGSDRVPAGGDFHGVAEIMGRWLPELGANYEDLRLSVDEFIGDGDSICACGTVRARVAGTDIKSRFCHVWHYRDGKVVEAIFHSDQVAAYLAIEAREAARAT